MQYLKLVEAKKMLINSYLFILHCFTHFQFKLKHNLLWLIIFVGSTIIVGFYSEKIVNRIIQ